MSSKPNANTGDLKTAVKNAMDLLSKDQSQLAREQAVEILRHYPDEINSSFVMAVAIRDQGDNEEALNRLQALVKRAPNFALAQQELGFVFADIGQLSEAIEALQRAVAIEPKLPASWKMLGELYLTDEDEKSAAEAMNQYVLTSSEEPDLIRAVNLFKAGNIAQAERLCRQFLYENPTNVTAIDLLADIAIKLGVLDDAENLLERCLELAPDFHMARLNYTHVLSKREKLEQALAQVDHMLEVEPRKKYTLFVTRAVLVEQALPAGDQRGDVAV